MTLILLSFQYVLLFILFDHQFLLTFVFSLIPPRSRFHWKVKFLWMFKTNWAVCFPPSHSSTPAWKIPWMEQPGRLQSVGSRRVRHDWATSLWLFTFLHWRRKWQPIPVFLPGESQGRGSLVGCRLWGSSLVAPPFFIWAYPDVSKAELNLHPAPTTSLQQLSLYHRHQQ